MSRTSSAYILGGAGTGKSTFTAALLDELGADLGPLTDLHSKPNKKAVVTLRGHYAEPSGLYLGYMRESFPGTDGLDRASSPTGEEWLDNGGHHGLGWIVGEGATLATRRFLAALARNTDLMVVHLHAPMDVRRARFAVRGSNQDDRFVRATATRSANRYDEARAEGVKTLGFNTAEPEAWMLALELVSTHLQ